MDITVELVKQRWCVILPGSQLAGCFAHGAAAFDAAAAALCELQGAGRPAGAVRVKAFDTSVDALTLD